jgi:signal transduction histidine kinase
MTSSMVLLVALQAFWLSNSYEKAAADFRGESSRYLREAVLAVRDSALLKTIEALPPDSTISGQVFLSRFSDSTLASHEHRRGFRDEGNVQVYVSSKPGSDSTRMLLRSIASQVHGGKIKGNSRFTIRFRNDSLNSDSIKAHFARALGSAGKMVLFDLQQSALLPPFPRMNKRASQIDLSWSERNRHDFAHRLFENDLQTEWVRVDPVSQYAAVLTNVRPLILKEITPQIFFGLFLTILTMISFIVMYRSIRSQQRLMAIKNDFISNITHELKTPIATVSVALEALKNFRGIDNPKLTSEYLDIAQLELGRLSMLTEKVLTTSMFDEDGVSLDYESVDLRHTVSTIISSMKLVVEKLNASITFDCVGDDFILEGSALHLTNVVYNLIDNALKYSPSGPIVSITLKDSVSQLELSIADKGLGIPTEYQGKIFDRFFRMPTGDVHNIKGHGLGLSYVDQVVKKHGGTISVSSVVGQGSIFTVVFPKQRK